MKLTLVVDKDVDVKVDEEVDVEEEVEVEVDDSPVYGETPLHVAIRFDLVLFPM